MVARGRNLPSRDVYRTLAAAPSQTALPAASPVRNGAFAASRAPRRRFVAVEDAAVAAPCAAGGRATSRLKPLTLSPVANPTNSGRLFAVCVFLLLNK